MYTRLSINDIKWDLIKIIEPFDGILENKPRGETSIRRLFEAYLKDLRSDQQISDFNVYSNIRDTAITYDVSIKVASDRSPRKLKIHVGTYQHPWI